MCPPPFQRPCDGRCSPWREVKISVSQSLLVRFCFFFPFDVGANTPSLGFVRRLFGDTMNTAARMESNGKPSKIHMSEETAQLLIAAGKASWVVQREDKISAKGKGEMTTFWLEASTLHRAESVGSGTTESGAEIIEDDIEVVAGALQELPLKTQRLVQWNASCLLQKLQDVVSKRAEGSPESALQGITEAVTEQVTHYVEEIARRYHDNPFHNFEHVRFIFHPCRSSAQEIIISLTCIAFCAASTRPRTLPCRLRSSCLALWLQMMTVN